MTMTQTTAQHTAHYEPRIVTEHNVHTCIADAYRAYGLEAPTRAREVKALMNADDNAVNVVVNRLAAAALEPGADLSEWHADAIEQIKDAQARQALSHAFGRDFHRHVVSTITKYQAIAHDDLQPHVAKTIKSLEAAAKHLPAGAAALDAEAVLAADAGKHLTTARQALSTLAVAAGVYMPVIDHDVPQRLRQLAPVVHFPAANAEQIERGYMGTTPNILNRDELDGTRTIRAIDNHARDYGLDATLVAIARGDFPGTSLAYADKAELSKRRSNLNRAHSRQSVDVNHGVKVL